MKKENWLPVKGYEQSYEVSSLGRVRNKYGKILKPDTHKGTGYLYVILRKDMKNHHEHIHRLIANAFIPNPNNYSVINHINENKKDNRIENLEWCTQSHNIRVSSKFKEQFKSIIQKDKDGNVIARYESIHQAAEKLGNKNLATTICRCARIRAGLIKGYKDMKVHNYIYEYETL